MTPVPAQAIHLRNPRRSMPSSLVFVSMKSDIMVCTRVDRIGRAVAHPSSGTYRLRSEIIPGRTGKRRRGINFNESFGFSPTICVRIATCSSWVRNGKLIRDSNQCVLGEMRENRFPFIARAHVKPWISCVSKSRGLGGEVEAFKVHCLGVCSSLLTDR